MLSGEAGMHTKNESKRVNSVFSFGMWNNNKLMAKNKNHVICFRRTAISNATLKMIITSPLMRKNKGLLKAYPTVYCVIFYIILCTSYIDYLPLLHYQAQVHFILPVTGNILSRNIMTISGVTL